MFCLKTILYLKRYIIRQLELLISQMVFIVIRYLKRVAPLFTNKHLQFLLTETLKGTVTTNSKFTWHVFREREAPHNLRKGQ